MLQIPGVLICLGYILGLLLTAVPGGGIWVFLLGIVGAVLFKRRVAVPPPPQKLPRGSTRINTTPPITKPAPHPKIWLIAGLVGLVASFYYQLRLPQPTANDISNFVPSGNSNNQEQLAIVRGSVETTPRQTRSQKGQFWFEATHINEVGAAKQDDKKDSAGKQVRGKLYVTVPLLQATGLYPGQQIDITGILYKPKAAANPGAFDFQKFLNNQGAFAGLVGRQINVLDNKKRPSGLWLMRERIVRSQVRWLGVPEGPLVSAMVVGSKTVDLPYNIRDMFIQAGLAHVLSASGFQTALILGVMLGLTKRAKKETQITLCSLALIAFVCFTGFEPPILRATVMGFAALIGLGLRRKVNQLGSLLVSAVILLLFNPLWIWDLGFLLSFLSTLGLIVTATAIASRLEWMPATIANLIAIPLAATIWTLPLQLYLFGVVPSYSLLLNLITGPFVSLISIGGIISALAALILPPVGSALAGLLHNPTNWLVQIVTYFTNLPASSVAVGKITVFQLIAIYTLILLSWLVYWWQKKWWLSAFIAIGLVFIPAWHSTNNLFRITVLASGSEPVLVIQDRGAVTLVNSGESGTGRYAIVPFLQQNGVNQIDWAIAADFSIDDDNGWLEVLQRISIKNFYDYSATANNAEISQGIQRLVQQRQGFYQPLTVGQNATTSSLTAQLINDRLPIIQMQIQGQLWLLVGNLQTNELRDLLKNGSLPRPQVLWSAGSSLKELVQQLQPQVAIAPSANLDEKDLSEISQSKTQLFFTGRDGAIQWTPQGQFEAFIQSPENKTSVL